MKTIRDWYEQCMYEITDNDDLYIPFIKVFSKTIGLQLPEQNYKIKETFETFFSDNNPNSAASSIITQQLSTEVGKELDELEFDLPIDIPTQPGKQLVEHVTDIAAGLGNIYLQTQKKYKLTFPPAEEKKVSTPKSIHTNETGHIIHKNRSSNFIEIGFGELGKQWDYKAAPNIRGIWSLTNFSLIEIDKKLQRNNNSMVPSKLTNQLYQLYQQAFDDQLKFYGGQQLLLPKEMLERYISENNLYAPAVIIKLLLHPPGHRLKREDVFSNICSIVEGSIDEITDIEQLEMLYATTLAYADVLDDPAGERYIIPKDATEPEGNQIIGSPFKSEGERLKQFSNIVLEQLEKQYQQTNSKELTERLKNNLASVASLYDGQFINWLDKQDKRRYKDLVSTLENDSDNIGKDIFANGSIVFISCLENRLDLYLHQNRSTGNNEPNTFKTALVITDLRVLCNKLLQQYRIDNMPTPKVTSTIAVVDQFPKNAHDVELIGEKEPVYDPDHGLTVAKIAQVSARGKANIKKYEAHPDYMRLCFETLRNDTSIDVINFSSVLCEGKDADYKAFYKLSQAKNVVIALGNNGRLLSGSPEFNITARENAEQGSAPFMEQFLQGFSKWAQENNKDISHLNLTICENYRMDKEALTERSSSVDSDHPLYRKVVRVRGDCVINPINRQIESGTSYTAPIVAGAIASVPQSKQKIFRESISGQEQIFSWENIAKDASRYKESRPGSLFDIGSQTQLNQTNIGSNRTGAAKPSLSDTDLKQMRNIMPAFGESKPLASPTIVVKVT